MTPTIRQALPTDLPALVALYAAMMRETGMSVEADSDKNLLELIQRPDALVLVAEAGCNVVGYQIAALVENQTVRIVSIYITPSHRFGRLAWHLLDDAIAWGITHGCKWCDCQTALNSVVHRGLEVKGFRVVRVEMRKAIGER